MADLDRNRPFEEAFGSSEYRYIQDGMRFDARGRAVKVNGEVMQWRELAPLGKLPPLRSRLRWPDDVER